MLEPREAIDRLQRGVYRRTARHRALHAKGSVLHRHLHRHRRGGRAVPGGALPGRPGARAGAVVQRRRGNPGAATRSQDVRGDGGVVPTGPRTAAAPPTCSARPRRGSRCAPPRRSSPSPRRSAKPATLPLFLARHPAAGPGTARQRPGPGHGAAEVLRGGDVLPASTPTAGSTPDGDRYLGPLHARARWATPADRPEGDLRRAGTGCARRSRPGWPAARSRFDVRVTVAGAGRRPGRPDVGVEGRPRAAAPGASR